MEAYLKFCKTQDERWTMLCRNHEDTELRNDRIAELI